MFEAHAQDFERKRRPDVAEAASPYDRARTTEVESSDEEDEEEDSSEAGAGRAAVEEGDEGRRADEEDVQGAHEMLRRHRSAVE